MDSNANKGMLFLIPSPISESGSWEFDPRIIKALRTCKAIVCERIRTTRRQIKYLFDQADFDKIQFFEIEKKDEGRYLQDALPILNEGHHVAVMSEAGMPCIADPGYRLVMAAHQNGIIVKPFPGPSSFMQSLMASGLNGQQFTFHGYLSRDKEELSRQLGAISKSIKSTETSQIFMETPYRNQKLYEQILRYSDGQTYLHISMDIGGDEETCLTKKVSDWKRSGFSFDKKLPAVFILGKIKY